jgi:26S proteasome regulatory subunit N10
VTIPPGPHLLSDVLLTSPIISGEDGPPPGFGGGSFEFGVDPSLDPELAMVIFLFIKALKMSMEEERARQNKNEGKVAGNFVFKKESNPMEEDPELAAALALSMGKEPESQDVDMEEDDEVAKAIAMSLQEGVFHL